MLTNASILLGYTEAIRRRPHGLGRGRGPDHSRDVDLVLFLVIKTHSSRRDDASDPFSGARVAGRTALASRVSSRPTMNLLAPPPTQQKTLATRPNLYLNVEKMNSEFSERMLT